MDEENWYKDYSENSDDDFEINEYDITSSPNDFNLLTLFNFMESGAIKIPSFQRNYVWDIHRASKLIESLILGLPVPQIFLYEEGRNKYLVIDGQQRLMSVYYFLKERFPLHKKRAELRSVFDEKGLIPDNYLNDDQYFNKFNLRLPANLPNTNNKFNKLNYSTLEEYQTQFNLRTIRCVIVKQNSPKDDDSSIYEIFNRLNTGGVNLRPQEIRTSLYHSDFYDMLFRINVSSKWRELIGKTDPDIHIKDVEILLRGFAMLIDEDEYRPSMTRFLNNFSKKCKNNSNEYNQYLEEFFDSFLISCKELPNDIFLKKNNQFNIALYEAVFAAFCKTAYKEERLVTGIIQPDLVNKIESDTRFIRASQEGTTSKNNVSERLKVAKEVFNIF